MIMFWRLYGTGRIEDGIDLCPKSWRKLNELESKIGL